MNWPITVTPGPECQATLDRPEAVAQDIYANLDQPTTAQAAIRALLRCLGLPILPASTDEATLRAYMDGPYPGVLDEQIGDLAAALPLGSGADLNSFVDDLASQGFTDRASGQPITRAALDAAFAGVIAAGGDSSVLPRLLVGLGQARVARSGDEASDAVWGDGILDSLQFLLFGMGLLALQAPTAGPGPAIAFVGGDGVQLSPYQAGPGGAIGGLSAVLGAPPQGPAPIRARTITCAAWILSRTSLDSRVTPTTVWHRGDPGPDTADLSFTLKWTPTTGVAGFMDIGCIPPSGVTSSTGDRLLAGNTVSWQPEGKATEHGSLTSQAFSTDANGEVHATYQTVAERTPQRYRTPPNEKSASVGYTVQVLDLVSGFSRTVFTMPSKTAMFTVKWYEKPLELEIKLEFVGTTADFSSIVNATGKVILTPQGPPSPGGAVLLEGRGTLTYRYTPIEGACRLLFLGGGTVPVKVLTHAFFPIEPASLAVLVFLEFVSPPTGTNIATECRGGKRVRSPVPAPNLFVLFLTSMLSPDPPNTLTVDDWTGTGTEPLLAQAVQAAPCDNPKRICAYVGNFYLRPAP